MKSRTAFDITTNEPALILYWPVAAGGLWDPETSELVELLEEKLEVFVTCVGSGRGSLRINDAVAAARFMGCSSLVVVTLGGSCPTGMDLEDASTGSRLPIVTIESDSTAVAVAAAYHEACLDIERAA